MITCELMLDIDPVDEGLEDAIVSTWDALVATHGESTVLTITAEGFSVESAARSIVAELEEAGARVRRLLEDLVTRSTIASRTGVTPQAVGLWVRGERQRTAFPAPYNPATGGLWLWGEVNQWLAANGKPADDIVYPSREDYPRCNAWLLDRGPGGGGAQS
ncbi:MAG: hypothetical protein Q4G45_06695 [Actinomycetia bacterium]|nr:hypothetical protein [Actinomycetes bacterium]